LPGTKDGQERASNAQTCRTLVSNSIAYQPRPYMHALRDRTGPTPSLTDNQLNKLAQLPA
jgi:hypothetical protein